MHRTFESNEQSWRIYTNQFQTIHKATVRKTVWYDIWRDIQICRRGNLKTDPHKYHE